MPDAIEHSTFRTTLICPSRPDNTRCRVNLPNTPTLYLYLIKIFCLLCLAYGVILPLRYTGLPVFPFRGAYILEA
jgi:hypothetical protein